jgi:putative ABC transport system permease protein
VRPDTAGHPDRIMLESYVRSAFRSLLRNRAASFINVVGLSIALASSVAVYLFLQVYYTLDTFHEHGARVFMVEHVVARDGAEQTWGTAPLPLGPALAADVPQVERAVRVAWAAGDVRTADAAFDERIGFADAGFFDVFTFPLRAGTPAALATPGTVVLSDAAARTYFGDADPMGRRLTIAFGDAGAQAFTVAGVAAPFPRNAGFRFDVLLPFDARPTSAAARADDWAGVVDATFLQLRRPEDLGPVAAQMGRYVARHNAAAPDAPIERFVFENLARPAPDGYTVLQRPTEAPHPAFSLIMVAMAGFMMALSCVNYVNISLGSAARRFKEIGVRKVMGGTRRQLIAQFMAENLLLCALAMVLGLALAWLFLIPLFNGLFVMQIALAPTENLGLWAFLAGLLAFVAVASGAYPALYVSSFQPALIFQGKQGLVEKRWLTRGLLTVQFVIAFFAVIATVVLLMNGRHLRGQAWGYDPEGLVVVRLSDPAQFERLRDVAAGQASVRRGAGSQDHVGVAMGRTRFTPGDGAPGEGAEHEAVEVVVGPGYAETLGLRLHSGRLFDERLRSDAAEAVVVNRRFVRERGWAEPLGQTLRIDRQVYTVVGVVEDFLYDPVTQPQPLLLRLAGAPYRFLTLRVAPGAEADVRALLEAEWAAHVPDLPFEAFTQEEVFDRQIDSYANLARGIGYLAALALLIACMGVFGLASQNVARRMKEVGVRKVLGASVPHLVLLVNRVFVGILAAAALVATAVSYGGLRVLVGLDAANVMPLTPLPFVVAYLLVLLPVAVSVASQSRALATANPAETLRRE